MKYKSAVSPKVPSKIEKCISNNNLGQKLAALIYIFTIHNLEKKSDHMVKSPGVFGWSQVPIEKYHKSFDAN